MYPDGIFSKKEKAARIERAYGKRSRPAPAKENVQTDGSAAAEARRQPDPQREATQREPDKNELRDFYFDETATAGTEKLRRGQYDPAEFRQNVYKVGFESPSGGGG